MSDDIYILGAGMIKFGKWLEKGVKDLTGEALDAVFNDCGLDRDDIEAAWFSNTMWGLYSFQHSIRGQVALTANGLDRIPITNVENACASASTALHGAWTAVKAGLYDCAMAIGVEKLYDTDRGKVMGSFMAGTDVEEMTAVVAKLKEEEKKRADKKPKEAGQAKEEKKGGHSAFMDFYAAGARYHMEKYGLTQRQLAVVAAKAHNNSVLNPLAQYNFPQTVEQVLEDRAVAFPLTRAMCAPIGDGAAAAIICNERFLKKHPSSRAVKIRASVLQGGTRKSPGDISERAAKQAYEIAGVGPEDIDVIEVHDATAYGEISQAEALGFCAEGEGGILAESGATALDGKIPINPSGGLISRGHPIGASGLAQIYELVTQLRGEAGKRQIGKHRVAMTENGGGTVGAGEAAMTIHILEKT
ncbi:MAG: thiolase family protein [Proteobacteria bacterium]|nr:thiolase family protein [Pseudomonadota bacterium]